MKENKKRKRKEKKEYRPEKMVEKKKRKKKNTDHIDSFNLHFPSRDHIPLLPFPSTSDYLGVISNAPSDLSPGKGRAGR